MERMLSTQTKAALTGISLVLGLLLGLLLVVMVSAADPAEQEQWVIECADCPKQFGGMDSRSLRLDADGHPHIAYGGDHLYYAWYDGTSWHYETADESSGVGGDASLDLDGAGYPHISYWDELNGALSSVEVSPVEHPSGRHGEVEALEGSAVTGVPGRPPGLAERGNAPERAGPFRLLD